MFQRLGTKAATPDLVNCFSMTTMPFCLLSEFPPQQRAALQRPHIWRGHSIRPARSFWLLRQARPADFTIKLRPAGVNSAWFWQGTP